MYEFVHVPGKDHAGVIILAEYGPDEILPNGRSVRFAGIQLRIEEYSRQLR